MKKTIWAVLLLCSFALLNGCGPRHISTQQEQVQIPGYALQDNSLWNEDHRDIMRDGLEAVFKKKGAMLEHLYTRSSGPISLIAVGSNRTGKLDLKDIAAFYETQLENSKDIINTGTEPNGTLLATDYDKETPRCTIEYIIDHEYILIAQIFTEEGWIMAAGSTYDKADNVIKEIRQFVTSITLDSHLKYKLSEKPASSL